MYSLILWANFVLVAFALFLGAVFQWVKLFSKKDLTDDSNCDSVSKNTPKKV